MKRWLRRTILAHWNMSHATNVSSIGRDVLVKWIKARISALDRSCDARTRITFIYSRRIADSQRLINTAHDRSCDGRVFACRYHDGDICLALYDTENADKSRERSLTSLLVCRRENRSFTSRNCEVTISLTMSNFIFFSLFKIHG